MGVPMPQFMVPFWGIVAALGGLSILLGYKAKVGAWLLVVFLFPTTFFMHPFWNSDTTLTTIMQGFCFWKNISLLGVSLMLAYTGSGPCSIEKS